jgi:hypothetical protein
MTEAEAHVLLHNWPGVGGLEAWIAGRRWKAVPGGWVVIDELEGWLQEPMPTGAGMGG